MLRTELEITNTINSWLSSFFDQETKIRIKDLKVNKELFKLATALI